MKKEEQREERREAILKYCLSQFIQVGFGDTKIRDIAKALNMSTGLFFHYFNSKESIYEELVNIAVDSMSHIARKEGESPLDFFRRITIESLYYFEEDEMTCQLFVLMNQTLNNHVIPSGLQEKIHNSDSLFTMPIPIIQEGQIKGEIREGDPLALSVLFWSTLKGIAETRAAFKALPLPEAEWVISVLKA